MGGTEIIFIFILAGVNFLVADGNKFSHPLYHLGKTTADLPILAIDSFRHMYLLKQNVAEDLEYVHYTEYLCYIHICDASPQKSTNTSK